MAISEYLEVDEACLMLGVKRSTLYGYVSSGVLQSYKRGIHRETLYRREDVEALLCIRPRPRRTSASMARGGKPDSKTELTGVGSSMGDKGE